MFRLGAAHRPGRDASKECVLFEGQIILLPDELVCVAAEPVGEAGHHLLQRLAVGTTPQRRACDQPIARIRSDWTLCRQGQLLSLAKQQQQLGARLRSRTASRPPSQSACRSPPSRAPPSPSSNAPSPLPASHRSAAPRSRDNPSPGCRPTPRRRCSPTRVPWGRTGLVCRRASGSSSCRTQPRCAPPCQPPSASQAAHQQRSSGERKVLTDSVGRRRQSRSRGRAARPGGCRS